jgi:hypothetical protein
MTMFAIGSAAATTSQRLLSMEEEGLNMACC